MAPHQSFPSKNPISTELDARLNQERQQRLQAVLRQLDEARRRLELEERNQMAFEDNRSLSLRIQWRHERIMEIEQRLLAQQRREQEEKEKKKKKKKTASIGQVKKGGPKPPRPPPPPPPSLGRMLGGLTIR